MELLKSVFQTLPEELRDRLVHHFTEIRQNFALGKYEPSELNGGKFCEVVYRILEWHTSGDNSYTPLGKQMDFAKLTRQLESKIGFSDAVRLHIPRVLNAVYTFRNKRGVAHHTVDIDPNRMDAFFVVASANWIMAELVRLFYATTPEDAQKLVENITIKEIPVIWEVGSQMRVLSPSERKLKAREKILILLYYAHPDPLTVESLLAYTEYDTKNKSRFRNSIIQRLHSEDLVHHNKNDDQVHLSPLGLQFVEKNLPLSFQND